MKAKVKTKNKTKAASKPTLKDVQAKAAKPKKKKSNLLKIIAATVGLLGVASALLVKKEKAKSKTKKPGASQ
jgi:hypothetical protein